MNLQANHTISIDASVPIRQPVARLVESTVCERKNMGPKNLEEVKILMFVQLLLLDQLCGREMLQTPTTTTDVSDGMGGWDALKMSLRNCDRRLSLISGSCWII